MRSIKPDFLFGAVLGSGLWLALCWCVNNLSSPFFWRSFP